MLSGKRNIRHFFFNYRQILAYSTSVHVFAKDNYSALCGTKVFPEICLNAQTYYYLG